jgi:hypothetical protein
MLKKGITAACFTFFLLIALVSKASSQDIQELVQAAVEYYRGIASIATVAMTIHRPGWERTMTMKAWTKGQKKQPLHDHCATERQGQRHPQKRPGNVDV